LGIGVPFHLLPGIGPIWPSAIADGTLDFVALRRIRVPCHKRMGVTRLYGTKMPSPPRHIRKGGPMDAHLSLGNPPIDVALKHSARARRMSLRVSRLNGQVSLTLPNRTPKREALTFLQEREAWLRKHIADVQPEQTPSFGRSFPFMGRNVTLHPAPIKRPMVEEDALILPEGSDRLAPRLKAFLKAQARDRLAAACDTYAAQLGKPYGKLTLRDTRSRWGSCTSQGDLMFSWRLIMAPPQILDYVAAHEVAHLAEMNHSDAFWSTCAALYPNHKSARLWLRTEGNALHRWQL
jgi:predicted metal-dependent hydrolase